MLLSHPLHSHPLTAPFSNTLGLNNIFTELQPVKGECHKISDSCLCQHSSLGPYQGRYIFLKEKAPPRRHQMRRLSPVCITVLWVLGSYTDRQLLQYTPDRAVIRTGERHLNLCTLYSTVFSLAPLHSTASRLN